MSAQLMAWSGTIVAICLACWGTQLGRLCLLTVLTHPLHPPRLSPTHPPSYIHGTHDIAGCVQTISQNQPVQQVTIYASVMITIALYCISGANLLWLLSSIGKLIQSFLKGRKQRVTINGFKSTTDVVSGVPQGSVLGPIFFLIYINDLPCMLFNPYLLFADDIKIYNHNKSEDDVCKLQQDIFKLEKWSEMWQMPFNFSKCKSLHMGRTDPNHVYSMVGCNIEQTNEERDLGVLINNQLKFHNHLSTAISKARRLLGLISKSFIN